MPEVRNPASAAAPVRPQRVAAMVGRDREMAEVRNRLEMARDGSGSVVLIAGEPGIGKSRLTREAAAAAEGMGFRTLWGFSYENEGAVPFRTWLELLRDALRLLGDEPAARYHEVRGLLGEAQGGHLAPVSRLQLFDAVAELLADSAAAHPQLLIFEDLHWADRESLDLFLHVARRAERLPMILIATFRDSEVGPAHPFWQVSAELHERRIALGVELRGLTLGDTAEMIGAGWPELAARWRPYQTEGIWRQTDGNPFFIEEVMRHLEAVSTNGGQAAVSTTVKHVIERRLQKIEPGLLQILRQLAVLGREFSGTEAERLTGLTAADLARELAPAIERRFLEERPAGYRFAHALVSNTLQAGIAVSEQPAMHLGAARAIQAASNGATAARSGEVFRHLAAAGALADEKDILDAYDAAEGRALQLGAVDEVSALMLGLREAAVSGAVDPLGASRRIAAALGKVATAIEYEHTRRLCEFAIPVLESAGRTMAAAIAKTALALTHQSSARRELLDFDVALRLVNEIEPVFSSTGDLHSVGLVRGMRANSLFQLGRCEDALQITQTTAAEASDANDSTTRDHHLALGGFYLAHLGRIGEAINAFESAWPRMVEFIPRSVAYFFHPVTLQRRLRAPGHSLVIVEGEIRGTPRFPPNPDPRLRVNRMYARREMGILPADEDAELLRFTPEIGDEGREDVQSVHFRSGKWDTVLGFYRELYGRTLLCGAPQVIPMVGVVYAGIARTAGRLEEAGELLREARQVRTPLDVVTVHAESALLAVEEGRLEAIRAHVRACREQMNDDDWYGLGARVDLIEALAELWEGNDEIAGMLFRRATGKMEEVEFPWDIAEAHHQHGIVLGRLGRRLEARAEFAASETILERVYAGKPFFDRLARVREVAGVEEHSDGARSAGRSRIPGGRLSERELEVLGLLAEGRSNREIARILVVSETTVATHVRHILEKVGAANRTEAAALAFRHGLANSSGLT